MRNWKKIIERLKFWQEKDYELQNAMDVFSKAFAPDSYSLILNYPAVDSYIEGVANDNEEIKDMLLYAIYEAPSLKGRANVKDTKGQYYDFHNTDEIIKYFENNHNE